jgi:hypothetical protein
LAALASVPQLPSRTIDLHQWGYPAPAKPAFRRGEFYGEGRLVSVYDNGSVVVGFVDREGAALAAREAPALALHTLTFDRSGKFLFEEKFPTTMRDDNSIFVVTGGNLLVRTADTLTLWSHERGIIAKRRAPDLRTTVGVSPNRQEIVLITHGAHLEEGSSVEALSARDLRVLESCPYKEYWVGSPSNHNIAIGSPSQYTEPHQRVRVDSICGPTQFEFGWSYPAGHAFLLDDRRLVINGLSAVELVEGGTVRWRNTLGKGEGAGAAAVDERGDILAVEVSKYVGYIPALDIDGHLKWMKVILYGTADGSAKAELVVEHPPRYSRFLLALSPDGSVVAVLCEGFLQIAEVR